MARSSRRDFLKDAGTLAAGATLLNACAPLEKAGDRPGASYPDSKILIVAVGDDYTFIERVDSKPTEQQKLRPLIRAFIADLPTPRPRIDYIQGRPGYWEDPSPGKDLADNLKRRHVQEYNLVFTVTSAATKVTQEVVGSGTDSSAPPILFAVVSEPISEGIVSTETEPRQNRTTGISTSLAQNVVECAARFYLMFSDQDKNFMVDFLYRDQKHCHVAYNAYGRLKADAPGHIKRFIKPIKLGPKELPVDAIKAPTFQSNSMNTIKHGLMLSPDDRVFAARDMVVQEALKKFVPTFVQDPDLVDRGNDNGPLAGFGLSSKNIGGLAARYAYTIITDSQKANLLPIIRPTDFEFKVSDAVADRLGIPASQISSWREGASRRV